MIFRVSSSPSHSVNLCVGQWDQIHNRMLVLIPSISQAHLIFFLLFTAVILLGMQLKNCKKLSDLIHTEIKRILLSINAFCIELLETERKSFQCRHCLHRFTAGICTVFYFCLTQIYATNFWLKSIQLY